MIKPFKYSFIEILAFLRTEGLLTYFSSCGVLATAEMVKIKLQLPEFFGEVNANFTIQSYLPAIDRGIYENHRKVVKFYEITDTLYTRITILHIADI